ncbi:double-stranded RNA-specific editase Adar-like isoform X3 [Leptotrombidium deliense]|uniref:Double-stranded RNA-specific editase Adar-like isoform X3 n=1 Tax=Leptotrombidium deliense TaxID=299467 RepID=A0A443SK13_9ACAR|nr:double-stranded RNA-specific editase Adar-like isoform X3 [Leptotrombidium deliense]
MHSSSPVQSLMETFKERGAVRFAEEGRRGPPHDPTYRYSCTVFGDVFLGHGKSKQAAKQDSAKNALQFIGASRRRVHPYMPRMPPFEHRNFMFRPPQMRYPNVDDPYACPPPPPIPPFLMNCGSTNSGRRVLLPHPSPSVFDSPQMNNFSDPPNLSDSNEANAASVSSPVQPLSEFASDDLEVTSDFVKFDDTSKNKEEVAEKTVEIKKQKNKERIMLRILTESSEQQNPVALIHELNPDCEWQFLKVENCGRLISSFTMQLKINDSRFTGIGRTKKLAKMDAAKTALSELYNINLSEIDPTIPKSYVRVDEPLTLDQNLANSIGNAVLQTSKQIFDHSDELKKWSVLASIVLTSDQNAEWFDVLCITSGTKCVRGDNLSMLGYVVGDCHAEILARRCFNLYLYRQINSFLESGYVDTPDYIIERREDLKGFKLKSGIKVHLFVSTAPCGDARVFSPKEEVQIDSHPNRQSRGVLRAKIENGEGTIPVKKESATLTWDGILQGHQRLQFMSCSDKICLWSVVGIQGSLLSHIIDPIYLSSVVVGSLFNYEHLVRAIHGRLNLNFESDAFNSLCEPFRINKAKVAKSVLKEIDEQRQVTKTPPYAVNWIKGDARLEIISCDTGKLIDGSASRLSKKFLFAQFCNLLGRNVSTLQSSPLNSCIPVVYRDAKTSAQNYQKTKTCVMQAFIEQNLGNWIQVPTEIDLFNL